MIKNGPIPFVFRQIMELRGPIPEWLRKNGKAALNFFTEGGLLMRKAIQEEEDEEEFEDQNSLDGSLYEVNKSQQYGMVFLFNFLFEIYL